MSFVGQAHVWSHPSMQHTPEQANLGGRSCMIKNKFFSRNALPRSDLRVCGPPRVLWRCFIILFVLHAGMPTTRSHHAWQPQINARFKAVYSGIHLFLLAGEFDTQSHASIALNMFIRNKGYMYVRFRERKKLCEIWIVEGELHSLESVHACVWRILLVW